MSRTSGGSFGVSPGPVTSVAGKIGDVVLVHTDVSDWTEAVEDVVALLLVAGTSIGLVYDDIGNTLTISMTGVTTSQVSDWAAAWDTRFGTKTTDALAEGVTNLYFTNERVDDRVAALVQAGTHIALSYNDPANTFTISVTGLASTDLSDFAAAVQSQIGSHVVGGTGITATFASPNTTIAIDTAAENERIDDRVAALLIAGNAILLTYNDAANSLTVDVQYVEAPTATQTASGIVVTGTYGESIVPGDLLYYDATAVGWKKAVANSVGKYPAIGLALETAASGTHKVLLHGIYRDDTRYAFTVGTPVYLSTTAGTETQTQPSATDNAIQMIGVALHADRLYFRPDLTYITHT